MTKNTINPPHPRLMIVGLSQVFGSPDKENFDHDHVLDDLWLNPLFGLIGFIIFTQHKGIKQQEDFRECKISQYHGLLHKFSEVFFIYFYILYANHFIYG